MHEGKQYKKALKAAETLLKTYPDHGGMVLSIQTQLAETLALKGLILFSMDKHDEAYESVRKGLRNDVTSALCWDVMSHLHLEKKNFKEASKCVSNALLFNPVCWVTLSQSNKQENVHLIRELAFIHVQNRDYANFQVTQNQSGLSHLTRKCPTSSFKLNLHKSNTGWDSLLLVPLTKTTQEPSPC